MFKDSWLLGCQRSEWLKQSRRKQCSCKGIKRYRCSWYQFTQDITGLFSLGLLVSRGGDYLSQNSGDWPQKITSNSIQARLHIKTLSKTKNLGFLLHPEKALSNSKQDHKHLSLPAKWTDPGTGNESRLLQGASPFSVFCLEEDYKCIAGHVAQGCRALV